jgi:sulfide:quinone oxidoreductase
MLGRSSQAQVGPRANPLEVVIAGGGVGALEASLALSQLAGARVNVTLVAPLAEFSYQPMAVLEPFALRSPRTLELSGFAAEQQIDFVQDAISSVEVERAVVHTAAGRALPYDALIIAVGARPLDWLAGAISVQVGHTHDCLRELIEGIDGGSLRSVAFAVPHPTWPLPAYELALLLREHALERDVELELSVLSAERAPLEVFGAAVSDAVREAMREAAIELVLGAEPSSVGDGLAAGDDAPPRRYDRVIALPRLQGPAIDGLPANGAGFLPVTGQGEVVGAARVFAVGDASDFPVKYGALAAAQADAAAAAIAAAAGAQVDPHPFDGTVHGFLLRGRRLPRLHFSARIEHGTAHDSRVADAPTHELDAKIAARYLGPYLDARWAAGARWLAGPWAGASSSIEPQLR